MNEGAALIGHLRSVNGELENRLSCSPVLGQAGRRTGPWPGNLDESISCDIETLYAVKTRPAEGGFQSLGLKPTAKSAGCSIRVTINDRSPYVRGRIIDLTLAAADALRVHGLGMVRVARG